MLIPNDPQMARQIWTTGFMDRFNVATIGFTKTTAERFFGRLTTASIRHVIDVRLNNTSQLAGFAKANDLKFFLKSIAEISYSHLPILAPTSDILDEFKKNKGDWSVYQNKFLSLMSSRQIEDRIDPATFDQACLLCSEDKPHNCHRKLVCDYLNGKWGGSLAVRHL